MCATTCEVVWLRRLLQDVGEEQRKAMIIKCDNQSSIKLENNPIYHSGTKHVDTQFHFVQEKMQSNDIDLMYCNINENVVDIFSKRLGKIKFELFRGILSVEDNLFSIKEET